MNSTDIMLNAAHDTDTGRIKVIENDGTEHIYTSDEWRALDLETVTRMAQEKNVLVEKTVDAYDEMEIQDYIDLIERRADITDLSCFLNNANDTTVQICFKERHNVEALKKYNVGRRYWYLIW